MPASANELYLAVQQARALSDAGLVPQVTGLRLVSSTTDTNGTVATLVWTHPEAVTVDHYEVFTKNLLNSNEQPLFATAVTGSPAVVRLTPTQTGNVTVAVQVVLPDGRRSDLAAAPTVVPTASQSSLTPAAIAMETPIVSGLVLTNNSPGAGQITWSACTLYYNGIAYSIPSGNTSTSNKYVTWTVGASVFAAVDSYTAGPTVFVIATNDGGVVDVAWNKLANNSITDQHINGLLTAIQVQAASIDTTKLNIPQIIVVNLVLTNNSPGAGSIAWSACTVFYNGNAYAIAAGNTSSKYVTWTAGAGTFTAANSYTSSPTVFPIATNTSGAADVAWNKLAKSGVQEEHLGFALNAGYQIQNASTQVVGAVNLAPYTDTKTLLAAPSEAGYMIAAAIRVTWPGGNTYLNTFLSTAYIRIQVDGSTPTDIPLYKSSASGSTVSSRWDTTAKALANDHEGTGSAAENFLSIPLGITYRTSANVYALMVNTGDPMTNWGDGAPSVEISLIRAVKVN